MSFLELLKIEFMKVKRSKIVPLIFIAPLLVDILSNRVLTAIWHYTVAFDVGESGIAGIPESIWETVYNSGGCLYQGNSPVMVIGRHMP